jgi:hypothetical protein
MRPCSKGATSIPCDNGKGSSFDPNCPVIPTTLFVVYLELIPDQLPFRLKPILDLMARLFSTP